MMQLLQSTVPSIDAVICSWKALGFFPVSTLMNEMFMNFYLEMIVWTCFILLVWESKIAIGSCFKFDEIHL